MVGAPQGAMRHASQIWQVVFVSQTLEVFCLALRKKAQYVVVGVWGVIKRDESFFVCAFTPQKNMVFIELQFALGILCLRFRV
jgi:hypothetical protein